MYDNVYFKCIREHATYPIVCYTIDSKGETEEITFNWYGKYALLDTAKCVIFPKGKTTWEGFHKPFKDGDIVATNSGAWIGIITGGEKGGGMPTYCVIKDNGTFEAYLGIKKELYFSRFATEEEKQKLFKAIKDHGYKWSSETKTLETLIEPKFKVGDRVRKKGDKTATFTISDIGNLCYYCGEYIICNICYQDDYELVPNKFDINTLKPLQPVLVRDSNIGRWDITFYELYDSINKIYPYRTLGGCIYKQCIPYEENEYLLGKTDDCNDFYKTWE